MDEWSNSFSSLLLLSPSVLFSLPSLKEKLFVLGDLDVYGSLARGLAHVSSWAANVLTWEGANEAYAVVKVYAAIFFRAFASLSVGVDKVSEYLALSPLATSPARIC